MEERQFLATFAGRILLFNAAGFERRVCRAFEHFPYKLFLLVQAPRDLCCEVRRQVAAELLGTEDRSLEVNSRKIKARFEADLREAQAKGKLGSRLYWLLKGASILFKSDVREKERINKMIGLIDKRAPSSSVELKSSRVGLKFLMGEAAMGVGKSRSKWSTFRPVAQQVRQECLSGWDSFLEVQCIASRWEPSQPAPDCVPQAKILAMQGRLKPHLECHSVQHTWAASYNMYIHKRLVDILHESKADPTMPVAFCIGIRRPDKSKSDFKFWLSSEIVRRKHIVCAVRWEPRGKKMCWTELRNFKPLLVVIKEQFHAVKAGSSVCVMYAPVTSFGCPGSGDIGSAIVGNCKTIVKLEPPSAKLVKTVKAPAEMGSDRDLESEPATSGADSGQSAAETCAAEVQAAGLNLLAEEAEMVERACEGEAEDEANSDADDFQYYVAKGVAATCHPSVYDSDERLEEFAARAFQNASGEEVAAHHERLPAVNSIMKNACDISSSQNLDIIQQLQNDAQDLDAVEVAIETAVAQQACVEAMNLPPGTGDGASSSSYLAANNCWTCSSQQEESC